MALELDLKIIVTLWRLISLIERSLCTTVDVLVLLQRGED